MALKRMKLFFGFCTSLSAGPIRDRYASPASVRLTLRVVWFSSPTPSRDSKSRIASGLSAEGETSSRCRGCG